MSFSPSNLDNVYQQAPKRKRSVSDPESSYLPFKRLLSHFPWSSQNATDTISASAQDPEQDEVSNLKDEIQRQTEGAVKAERKTRRLRKHVEDLQFEIKNAETKQYRYIKDLQATQNEVQGIQNQLDKVWERECFHTYEFKSWKGESRSTHTREDFNLSDTDEWDDTDDQDDETEEEHDQYDDGGENDNERGDDDDDAATIQAL